MTDKYILDGHLPIKTTDLSEWAAWFETHFEERVVAQTQIDEDTQVSTVFLGLDHNFSLRGAAVLFETLVFGGPHGDEGERYQTWQEAAEGHARWVRLALGETGAVSQPSDARDPSDIDNETGNETADSG